MTGILSRLAPPEGARPRERRLGRGPGSGVGKVAARGMKGQKSRKPGNIGKLHFQGGQTPLQRRLPKRGFRVPFPVRTGIVSLGALERFDAGTEVDEALLRSAGVLKGVSDRVKVLSNGELTKALTVTADAFSAQAAARIVAAGGQALVRQRDGSTKAVEGDTSPAEPAAAEPAADAD